MKDYCTKNGQTLNDNLRKKNYIFLVIIILVVIIALSLIGTLVFGRKANKDNYVSLINNNWNILLPDCDEQVYYIDDQSNSPFGDSDRYSILKYNEPDKINSLDTNKWNQSLVDEDKAIAERILKKHKVPDNKKIDFNKNLLYMSVAKYNFSYRMILVYDKEEHLVYVFERMS